MPRKSTSIAIESNNQKLSEIFLKLAEFSEVHFEKDHGLKSATYCVYLADLSADITSLSQEIIELIQACQSKNIKIAICLVFAEKINIEKVSYLKNLLGSLNQSPPLYRLLLIRDLYQDVLPQPVTFLDKLLWQSIQDLHWHTSTKGKKTRFTRHIWVSGAIAELILSLNKAFFIKVIKLRQIGCEPNPQRTRHGKLKSTLQ